MNTPTLYYVTQHVSTVSARRRHELAPNQQRSMPQQSKFGSEYTPGFSQSAINDVNETVRKTIEFQRISQNMTLKDLSDRSGISENALCAFEDGSAFPSAQEFKILEGIFDTSFDF